jgi:hypothetical protein
MVISPESINRLIQLIVTPAVMLSACAILVSGVLNRSAAINDRLRTLNREQMELLGVQASASAISARRVRIIDTQFSDLLRRLRIENCAILALYCAVIIFILDMISIAGLATTDLPWLGMTAIGFFGMGILIVGFAIGCVAYEVRISLRSITYEVDQVRRFGVRSWNQRNTQEGREGA